MWSKDDAGRIRFRLSAIAAQSAVKKLLHYRNFGFNRIGDETLVVCAMMHLIQLLRVWLFIARPGNLRVQLHPRNRQSAFRIFFHVADRFVGVVIEHKLLFTCDREKSEHVTTGERGDERFLGIDVGRIAKISRRGRSRHGVAAVEAPGVVARIFLINKFGAAALPTQSYFVFGHAFVYAAGSEIASNPEPSKSPGKGAKPRPATAATEELPLLLLFGQISSGRRSLDPIHVPRPINGD